MPDAGSDTMQREPAKSVGIAFIDSGNSYFGTQTGPLHSILMKWKKPPNKAYIAASLLMDAEQDWHLRSTLLREAEASVHSVIKEYLRRFPTQIDLTSYEDGEPYMFGGRVSAKDGARVHWIFESEVATTLNAMYMVSERVQSLVRAVTQAGLLVFKSECNKEGTSDGLNGITSRLLAAFEKSEPEAAAQLDAARKVLLVRSSRTHTGHLNANYEIREDNSVADVRFYFLSPKGDGSRDYVLRMSDLPKATRAYRNFLAWFVNQVDSGVTEFVAE